MNVDYERRAEAAAKGEVRYMPSKPCRRGHTSERYTSTGNCIACLSFKVGRQLTKAQQAFKPFPIPVQLPSVHVVALRNYLIECAQAYLASSGTGLVLPINPQAIQWAKENARDFEDAPF